MIDNSSEPVALAATGAGAGLPPHVHETVMRALAKSAQDRPTSAKAFYDELTLARSRHSVFRLPPTSRPSGAPAPSASIGGADTLPDADPSFAQILDEPQRPGGDAAIHQRTQRTARRWRVAALLLALVVVALGLGIVVMEITHHAAPEPRRKPKPVPTVAPSSSALGR